MRWLLVRYSRWTISILYVAVYAMILFCFNIEYSIPEELRIPPTSGIVECLHAIAYEVSKVKYAIYTSTLQNTEYQRYFLILFISVATIYAIATLISLLLIPKDEYKKIFISRNIKQANIRTVEFGKVAMSTFIVLIGLCVYATVLLYVENSILSDRERIRGGISQIGNTVNDMIISIDGNMYSSNIIRDKQKINLIYTEKYNFLMNQHEKIKKNMCIGYKNNVESFLDWYYSLAGEYTRIAALLGSKSVDVFMHEKLTEHLSKNINIAHFDDISNEIQKLTSEYAAEMKKIMEENRLLPGSYDKNARIVPQNITDFISLKTEEGWIGYTLLDKKHSDIYTPRIGSKVCQEKQKIIQMSSRSK